MTNAAPVTATVCFNVTVTSYNREDRWMAQTVETGLITFGSSREEAEALNARANVKLVKAWKQNGRLLLNAFMRKHGIKYEIEPHVERSCMELPLAA